MTAAVALTFVNFGVAGFSDLYKSFVKARQGPDTLVTTGPFRWFRHPNYTSARALALESKSALLVRCWIAAVSRSTTN